MKLRVEIEREREKDRGNGREGRREKGLGERTDGIVRYLMNIPLHPLILYKCYSKQKYFQSVAFIFHGNVTFAFLPK